MSDMTEKRIMKVGELRAALADHSDDAVVTLWLNANGTGTDIKNFEVHWSDVQGPGDAATTEVYLIEIPHTKTQYEFDDQIRLGLPIEFHQFCESQDVTPEQVLYGFMADLAYIRNSESGLRSNGSDERMYAQQYFDRCEYALPNDEDVDGQQTDQG